MKAFRNEGYLKNVNGTGNISRKPLSKRRLIRAALAIASKQQRAAARSKFTKNKGEPQ